MIIIIFIVQDSTAVELDFLGKDSMRYHRTIPVDSRILKNLQYFVKEKKPSDKIFDRVSTPSPDIIWTYGQISPVRLNTYLQGFMPQLTAKVFRTYNASVTMEQELAKLDSKAFVNLPPQVLWRV